jgi:hypothetical protein
MNFRDTAWLREAHDRMECPPECPICARIEGLCDQEERGPREFYNVFDYPEER